MPAMETRPGATTRATASAKGNTEKDAKVIERVAQALEAFEEDLASIGGSLRASARDLRKDVERMLRDARRDLKKMGKALQRDLEQLQRDLKTPAKAPSKDGPARATAATAGKSRPKAAAASH
jgi:hypothetical protein